MSYSLDRFLRPLKDTDKTIRIFDDRNFPVHTINPFSVLRIFVTNSNLNVALSGNRTIVLDFSTHEETKEALAKLQSFVDQLRQKVPQVIDKETEQYVQNIIQQSTAGIGSLNGVTASQQTLVVEGDDNLNMAIQTIGSTHSISLTWTGILPMDRGGLNNTNFNEGELLVSDGVSVLSSGFIVNDADTSESSIWTSKKIDEELKSFIYKESPLGDVDGVNAIFTLNYQPILDSEHVFMNGLLLDEGLDNDYILDGNKIIFNEAPPAFSKIKCTYKRVFLLENI